MNKRIIIGLLIISGLFAAYAGLQRYRIEMHNRSVALTIDYTELQQLSGVSGESIERLMEQFHSNGISAVAVPEDTIASLVANGTIWMEAPNPKVPGVTFLKVPKEITKRCELTVKAKLKTSDTISPETKTVFDLPSGRIYVPASYLAISNLSLGVDPLVVQTVLEAKLEPFGRVSNSLGDVPSIIRFTLSQLHDLRIRTVIFSGNQVLGARNAIKETSEIMKEFGINYGAIEFGKQAGDAKLTNLLPLQTVRVHSVSSAEGDTLTEPDIVDRFVRAAKERNIRVCYVRLVTNAGLDPVNENLESIEKITAGLERAGIKTGSARPFADPNVPRWFFPIIALGVGAGLWGLWDSLFQVNKRGRTVLFILMLLISALAFTHFGQKAVALLATLIFPTWAVISCAPKTGSGSRTGVILQSIMRFIGITLFSLVGALFMVGLLAQQQFIIKADQFMGIKLAHSLPLVIIGIAFLAGLDQRATLKNAWASIVSSVDAPIKWWQSVLTLVVLVAIGLMVVRTGNEAPTSVSGTEMRVRSLMDRVLPVRPRTKEFMLGHPLLIIAIGIAIQKRRRYLPLLMMAGAIGQVSVVNTLCHIHTPLSISVVRIAIGTVFGAIIGICALWLILTIGDRKCKAPTIPA